MIKNDFSKRWKETTEPQLLPFLILNFIPHLTQI